MPIEQAAKQPASEQTRAAKRRQRHGNGARIDVRDLRITFTPDTALAVDSLYLEQSELGIFADEFFQAFAPDSLQLPL